MKLESSVTLFDDNKVEDRFAELQITADGITSEVSKKVGNDEVISRINQSAEGVQIQANKVNVEGAAIFSSGRLSQSSLNSAYDANGAATGAVDTLKSDLSSSSGTTVINGGHIVTGTLSAGAVNANSGTFNTANIPDLSAEKITTGTLSAARIGTGSLEIGKLNQSAQNTINDAGTKATNYLSPVGNSGITVHAVNNPTSNYVQIDGSGMNVYNSGTSVANFGSSARLGKQASNHVDISPTAISMSEGSKTLYEVVNASSGAVKITQVYNVSVTQDSHDFTDTIGLGRTVASWVNQGIVLNYKLNGTTQTPVKFSSMPIDDEIGSYIFKASLSGSTVSITWSCPVPSSDTLTLVSLELNFNTSQQVAESTLGAYADKTQSGAFRVGKGTSTSAKANAMLVDWNGNGRFSGDVVVGCNANSSGGLSLSRVHFVGDLYYEASNGIASIEAYRVGKIVMMYVYCEKTSSTSAGGTVYAISLAGTNFPVPVMLGNGNAVTGVAYHGNHAIVCSFERDEESGSASNPISQCKLYIKNASASSVTLSDAINCSLTYICE